MFFILVRQYKVLFFFFSSRRRHTRFKCDWSSDVCSSDLHPGSLAARARSFLGRAGSRGNQLETRGRNYVPCWWCLHEVDVLGSHVRDTRATRRMVHFVRSRSSVTVWRDWNLVVEFLS